MVCKQDDLTWRPWSWRKSLLAGKDHEESWGDKYVSEKDGRESQKALKRSGINDKVRIEPFGVAVESWVEMIGID